MCHSLSRKGKKEKLTSQKQNDHMCSEKDSQEYSSFYLLLEASSAAGTTQRHHQPFTKSLLDPGQNLQAAV